MNRFILTGAIAVATVALAAADAHAQQPSPASALGSAGRPPTMIPLKAQSRTNVPVSGLFLVGTNAKFGALIESNGVPIVVERAMYSSAGGVTWTAGTAAIATKLQQVPAWIGSIGTIS